MGKEHAGHTAYCFSYPLLGMNYQTVVNGDGSECRVKRIRRTIVA